MKKKMYLTLQMRKLSSNKTDFFFFFFFFGGAAQLAGS